MNGPLWKIFFARGCWRKSAHPAPQRGAIRPTPCQKPAWGRLEAAIQVLVCQPRRRRLRQTQPRRSCLANGLALFRHGARKSLAGLPLVTSESSRWCCLRAHTGLIGPCVSPRVCSTSGERETERIKRCSCWILVKIISFSVWIFFFKPVGMKMLSVLRVLCVKASLWFKK